MEDIKYLAGHVCLHTIIDKDSNNISLIEIIDQINIETSGTDANKTEYGLIDFEVVTIWERPEIIKPIISRGGISFISPDGKTLFQEEFDIDLQVHFRCNIVMTISGLAINKEGMYSFQIKSFNEKNNEWITAGNISLLIDFK